MPLEKQVCSLESSMKIKELGFGQESLFQWVEYPRGNEQVVFLPYPAECDGWIASAFTASELGEIALKTSNIVWKIFYNPKNHNWLLYSSEDDNGYQAPFGFPIFLADTEVECRAKLLIYLVEQKIMEVSNGK